MIKLIRSRRTGKYLSQGGGWTEEFEKAQRFKGIGEAMDLLAVMKLAEVEMVFCWREDKPTGADFAIEL